MFIPLRIFLLLLTFSGTIFGLAAATPANYATQQGEDFTYKAGHPDFSYAFGFIDEEQGSTLEITADFAIRWMP